MYTIQEATEEAAKRWANPALRSEVEAYLGHDLPPALQAGPRTIMARQVASPSFETARFFGIAKEGSLSPVLWTYVADRFASVNEDKNGLFHTGIELLGRKTGNVYTRHFFVADSTKEIRNRFCDIATLWGESFVGFHRRILETVFPEAVVSDSSDWIRRKGDTAQAYYPYYIALFVCHGVLVESFPDYGKEHDMTEYIVKPAIEQTRRRFGLEPLIVPLLPPGDEYGERWRHYPSQCWPAIPPPYNSHTMNPGRKRFGLISKANGVNHANGSLFVQTPANGNGLNGNGAHLPS